MIKFYPLTSLIMFKKDISLLPYNTFHFDCTAKYFIEISKISELDELIHTDIFAKNKRLILWWWANILLTEETFDGLVIKNNIIGKEIIKETENYSIIKVWAGENRDDFVWRTIKQWYCGLENLVSIPWSVWAAPMQNIWAYGVEVWLCIESVSSMILNKNIGQVQQDTTTLKPIKIWSLFSLNKKQCTFWYRDSIFKKALKDSVIITHVTFRLEKYKPKTYKPNIKYGAIQEKLSINIPSSERGSREEFNIEGLSPHRIATAISEIRASKLPDWHTLWTAGSFFKNPLITEKQFQELQKKFPELKWYIVSHPRLMTPKEEWLGEEMGGREIKLSAWQLIELVIWKKYKIWQVGTYEKHALVLVHHWGGKGKDIVALSTEIQKRVKENFWLDISPEVNFVK